MATGTTMVLEAATLSIDSNDVSAWLAECELTAKIDEKDKTTFASAGWKEVRGGQKSGGLKIKLLNDFTDNSLDEIFWALFIAGVEVTAVVTADDAAVSAANPSYSTKVLVTSWTPIKGKPGDLVEVDLDFPTSGAITRAVA
jgi:hypothetical protein